MMKSSLFISVLTVSLAFALPLQAACFADYKAKQDDPLKLHYGVIEVFGAACEDVTAAAKDIRGRIAEEGWQLLNVLGVFDDEGLVQRKDSAGSYFLRY